MLNDDVLLAIFDFYVNDFNDDYDEILPVHLIAWIFDLSAQTKHPCWRHCTSGLPFPSTINAAKIT